MLKKNIIENIIKIDEIIDVNAYIQNNFHFLIRNIGSMSKGIADSFVSNAQVQITDERMVNFIL